ncbi:uncharacterized protein LOC122318775 [Carya illinoinensis]|uniref:uncharacterized protein LOC122318775 n=1 Tax=Carya illinoinensis TaxID=32201 RepID=UPI001C723E70|nr:uncharacterized protein LOC122318775 [Carya illinoinensis]
MVVDLRVISNGAQEWNISLIRDAHDWEVTGMVEFLSLLYNTVIDATSEDKIVWKPSRKGKFSVCSFYDTITMQQRHNFPWKNIWRSKAPKKDALFVWTAALGKILTMDNLRIRGIIITEWCCMCRKNGETVDHLLLHCEFARKIWNFFFSRMDIAWVMPGRMIELIASWRGIAGTPQIVAVKYLQIAKKSRTNNPYRWVRYVTQANSYVTRI